MQTNPPTEATIRLLGEERSIASCGDSGHVLMDTCIDDAILSDVNAIGVSLLLVIVIVYCLRKAGMAG